jgi:hypothetical protein
MKAIRLYILPLFLLLASLAVLAKGIKVRQDAQATWKNVVNSQVQQQMNSLVPPDDTRMLSLRNLVQAIGRQYELPLDVTLKGPNLMAKPDLTKIKPEQLLAHDSNIYGFINTLSALPYRMEYESVCIGTGCGPEGFNLTIILKGV